MPPIAITTPDPTPIPIPILLLELAAFRRSSADLVSDSANDVDEGKLGTVDPLTGKTPC